MGDIIWQSHLKYLKFLINSYSKLGMGCHLNLTSATKITTYEQMYYSITSIFLGFFSYFSFHKKHFQWFVYIYNKILIFLV